MDKLKLKDGMVVDTHEQPVYLRGVNIGGWMNMENFINGFPGNESPLRALMAQALGEHKAAFFFERFLDHFFNEADVEFLKTMGVTAIRLPLNYRHFEGDMVPFEYLEAGFSRLDQVLQWCETHGIYAILDLHAVQGWQNGDWHCDNSSRHTLFWTHKQFQDRFYALWQEIARRYQGRAVVAAYNIMNEPLSNAPFGRFAPDAMYRADWANMNRIYQQTFENIREYDLDTIIIVEGDYYSIRFDGIQRPTDPNVMYSSHNYIEPATSDIALYPVHLNGTYWDGQRVKQQFLESQGVCVSQAHGVPLLVGEFGFNAIQRPEAEQVDHPQIAAFADQLNAYNDRGVHWTFWTYKAVGSMGWLQLNPACAYLRTIQAVITAKDVLRTDFGWLGGFPAQVEIHLNALSTLVGKFIPGLDPVTNKRYFAQAAMSTYTADQLQNLYVQQFVEKSEAEIDDILQSFRLERCIHNKTLDRLVSSHLSVPLRKTLANQAPSDETCISRNRSA